MAMAIGVYVYTIITEQDYDYLISEFTKIDRCPAAKDTVQPSVFLNMMNAIYYAQRAVHLCPLCRMIVSL